MDNGTIAERSSTNQVKEKKKFILYPHAHWWFAGAILITWIGFSMSYFARLQKVSVFHHIHGASAGLWMMLLVVQPILYGKNKWELHRKLGKIASFTLVPLLILGGLKMMQTMLRNPSLYPPDVPYQLAFIDAVSLSFFLCFFMLSIGNAKNIQLHARYITLTVLVVLPPAVTRALFLIPWFNSFNKTLNGSFVFVELILAVLLYDDYRSGKMRRPYIAGLLGFVLLHLTMNYAGDWNWWRSLMNMYAS